MSQPLPFSPQLPAFDARLPAPRERPAEDAARSAQRHNFGRLLDRFAQNDRGQDPAKDSSPAPQDQRPRERCSTTDDPPRPLEERPDSDTATADATATPGVPPHSAAAPADPAKPRLDPGQAPSAPTPTPTAAAVAAIVPVVAGAPTEAATAEAGPAVATVAGLPAVAASTAAAVDNRPALIAGMPAAAATTAARAATLPAEPVADATAAEAAAGTPELGQASQPATRARRTAAGTGTSEATAKAVNAATANATAADKTAADIAAARSSRLPAGRPEADMSAAADSNQGQPQFRVIRADASAAALDATQLATAREDQANAQTSADQAVASLTGIDSPHRTAALYHKVADAARPGADAPTPADQVAIRLVHAVADGKRAIQMHLHPAELGAIDVKMQWQGDKLTAQFTVDRPETLQILQREVPALERSLGQAGVNVDSGSLSFMLRQQPGNGKGSGEGFEQAVTNAAFGDGGEPAAGDETLGQVIRDGILSIRV